LDFPFNEETKTMFIIQSSGIINNFRGWGGGHIINYNWIFGSVFNITSLWLKINSAMGQGVPKPPIIQFSLLYFETYSKNSLTGWAAHIKGSTCMDNTKTEKTQTCIHALSRVWTHNPNVWVHEIVRVLRQLQWSATESNISLYTSITYNYKPDIKITLIHSLYAKILTLLLSCYGGLYVITPFGLLQT